jgi:hypothetical protein
VANTDATPQTVPPTVAASAAQLHLGAVLDRFGKGRRALGASLFLLITGVAAPIVGFLLIHVIRSSKVFAPFLAYGIVAIIWSVIVLVRPTRQGFLYEEGLVSMRGSKSTALRWSDVATAEILVFGDFSNVPAMLKGKIAGYLIKTRAGIPVHVPSADAISRSPFETRMIQLIEAAGVQPTTRYVRQAKVS